MDFSANHIGFVIGAYGLSIVILTGLSIYVRARDRALRAEAERLEALRGKSRP